MAEYIEREAVLKKVCAACREYVKNIPAAAVQPIKETPSGGSEQAVAPVVHGEWRRSEDGEFVCVNCKQVKVSHDMLSFFLSTGRWNYCPNCGAKMDGVTFHQNRLLQPTGLRITKIGGAK